MGRSIGLHAAACAVLLAAGCGASSSEIRRAKRSAYKANFAIVWTVVTDEIRKRNRFMTLEDAVKGDILTDWKLVESRESDELNTKGEMTPGGIFMRYKAKVRGGPPWRVEVD